MLLHNLLLQQRVLAGIDLIQRGSNYRNGLSAGSNSRLMCGCVNTRSQPTDDHMPPFQENPSELSCSGQTVLVSLSGPDNGDASPMGKDIRLSGHVQRRRRILLLNFIERTKELFRFVYVFVPH